jgi:hypothetical protein
VKEAGKNSNLFLFHRDTPLLCGGDQVHEIHLKDVSAQVAASPFS